MDLLYLITMSDLPPFRDFHSQGLRSLSYPWRRARWMLMCAHRISSDTPFHLSSARLSRLALLWLGPPNWIPASFYHFLCCFVFVHRPLPLQLTLHLLLCLPPFHSFSLFTPAQPFFFFFFPLQRRPDILVELCHCKAIALGSDDVTTEQIFGHCVGMM